MRSNARAPALRVVRSVALVVALALATWVFLGQAHAHYPIEKWLFWRYAGYWLAALSFAASALCFGYALVRPVTRGYPLAERWLLAFAVGTLGFELALFLAGLLGLLRPALFFALPVALGAVGARASVRDLRRAYRKLRRAPRTGRAASWPLIVVAFGVAGFALVYFLVMGPDNVQFDSRWRHMALAEDYAASGSVRPFREGWIAATSPHFTSLLYAWAFLSPARRLFDHVVLAAHVEFVAFALTTLLGITALTRRLTPGADPRITWVSRFLFPGVLLYDSSLSGGADHVGALWGVAIALALWRCYERLTVGRALILAASLAGAALTKETVALLLVPFPVLAFAIKAATEGVRALRRAPKDFGWLRATGAALVGCVVLTAPYWLKNWVWYGNPVYPSAHAWFGGHPWSPQTEYLFRYYLATDLWRPKADLDGVVETLKALLTFSFVPHDWSDLHGDVPVFGSLFTLLWPCLLFFQKTRRGWGLVLWIHLAIATWFWVHHQDRYLQTLVPLMAAVVAGVVARVWRAGIGARVALVPLIGVQVIWGGDVYFFPTHRMLHGSPIPTLAKLMAAGHEHKYDQRFDFGANKYVAISLGVPARPDARVLLHELEDHLGVGRPAVMDWPTQQMGIDYGRDGSAAQAWRSLRALGVTHVAWSNVTSQGLSSLASDLVFMDLVLGYVKKSHASVEFSVGPLPSDAPPETRDSRVLVIACGDGLVTGVYELADLAVPVLGAASGSYGPPRVKLGPDAIPSLAAAIPFAVRDPSCGVPFAGGAYGLTLGPKRKPSGPTRHIPSELWLRISR